MSLVSTSFRAFCSIILVEVLSFFLKDLSLLSTSSLLSSKGSKADNKSQCYHHRNRHQYHLLPSFFIIIILP